MPDQNLRYRSVMELGSEGRTLLGVATVFGKAAEVSDFGGPRYLEALRAGSADKSLQQNPEPHPLYNYHGHVRGDDPIGVASFEATPEELLFRAPVSRTRAGDEVLELVRDGAMTDASLGYRDIGTKRERWPEGLVHVRTEIAIRELSVAPTGFGLMPGARVLALRAQLSFSDTEQALCDAITVDLFGPDAATVDAYVWLRDTYADSVVYQVSGPGVDEADAGLFERGYTLDAAGAVTLTDAEPVKVQVSYQPIVARAEIAAPEGLEVVGTPHPKRATWARKRAAMYRP